MSIPCVPGVISMDLEVSAGLQDPPDFSQAQCRVLNVLEYKEGMYKIEIVRSERQAIPIIKTKSLPQSFAARVSGDPKLEGWESILGYFYAVCVHACIEGSDEEAAGAAAEIEQVPFRLDSSSLLESA